MRILIVSKNQELAARISRILEGKGLETELISSGEAGEDYARLGIYEILMLDVAAPGKSAYEISRSLRNAHVRIPIILLTESVQLEDRIKCLKSGVDYALQLPYDDRELLACVDAMLQGMMDRIDEPVCGNTRLLVPSAKLVCGEKSVRLSAKEFEVMRLLFQYKDRLLSKELILARVWGYDSNAVENHVEVYVGFLRKKLRSIGSNIEIKAVRRMGYTLEVHE